jgi:hypothetical protein
MTAGRAFYGYQEARIQFPPTYRYEKGTTEWSKTVKLALLMS